jgi:predicted dehydrogenase
VVDVNGAARPLRIGILGAARIAPGALIRPAQTVPGVQVVAVAARDAGRAAEFARRHGIPRVAASYAELVADPELDAIYNPLPNGLHGHWTIRALAAGKHVLCEKPLAANATEAAAMAAAAQASGKVLMEAFHYRYHPLIQRMLELIASGRVGAIHHIETHLCSPNLKWRDIRYRYDLAGGATMDLGCYAIHLLRTLAGAEPHVTAATAALLSRDPRVDRAMTADFRFDDGRTGRIVCSMWSRRLLDFSAVVVGDKGTLSVINPYLPHLYHRLTLKSERGARVEKVAGEPTYTHQLRAFVAAVQEGAAYPTTPADAVANLRVIDAVYTAAGLPLRAPT